MKNSQLFSLLLLCASVSACRKEYITNNYILDPDYCVLEGRWLRVESNYAQYDGMEVEVNAQETSGIITKGPTTPDPDNIQVVGKVKWKDIRRESGDIFYMEDLTNDLFGAGRRSAVIAATHPDTLRISVKSNGSWQLWARVK